MITREEARALAYRSLCDAEDALAAAYDDDGCACCGPDYDARTRARLAVDEARAALVALRGEP